MGNLISAKADLVKIEGVKFIAKDGREYLDITDAALFKGATGARYLDLSIWETPGGQYGDWRVTQDLGKEARAAGKKGAILGNGKNRGQGAGSPAPAPAPSKPKGNQTGTLNDDFVPPF